MPSQSEATILVDWSHGSSWGDLRTRIENRKAKLRPEQLEKITQAEEAMGITVEELARFFDGRLAVSFLNTGDSEAAVGVVGLAPDSGFPAWVKEKVDPSWTTLEISGVTHWNVDGSLLFGYDQNWLYWSTSKQASEVLLSAVGGSADNLSARPAFKASSQSLDVANHTFFVLVDIPPLVERLDALEAEWVDKRTREELGALEYFAAASGREPVYEGLLKVKPDTEGGLVKALTTPGRLQAKSFDIFSSDTTVVTGLDLKWHFDLMVALGGLSPKTRREAAALPGGLMLIGNPFLAFSGEVLVGSNLLDVMPQLMAKLKAGSPPSPTDPGIPSVQICLPVTDLSAANRILARIPGQAEGLEPKSDETRDFALPFPETELKLSGPSNLASFSFGPARDTLPRTKGTGASNNALIKELANWAGEGMIYLDYSNLSNLLDSDLLDGSPGLAFLKEQISAQQLAEGVKGAACLRAGPEGVHFRAKGYPMGTLVWMGAGAAILAPNFIRARAQGQLAACKSNLKNLGTACEMWAVDHGGQYPTTVSQLSPDYLLSTPVCPAAGQDTYSASYQLKGDPRTYSVYCSGHHHKPVGRPPNSPSYNGIEGLKD